MAPLSGQTRYSIHHKSLDARKARILIRALIDCAKAGVKPSFSTTQMLRGLSLYLECGTFSNKSWRLYHRASDAAKLIVAAGEKGWKSKVTFEHVRPLSKMYQMFLNERKTLTLDRAAYIIGEYPPILITMEEEHRMAKRGFSVEGKPEQRYAGIAFSGFNLRSDGPLPGKVPPEKSEKQQSIVPLPPAAGTGPDVIPVSIDRANGRGCHE